MVADGGNRSRADASVGLGVFTILALLGHHTWGSIDSIRRFAVTASLVATGSPVTPEFGPVKYGPLQSFAMIPTYLLGSLVGFGVGSTPRQVAYRLTAFFFSPVLVALTCIVLRRTVLRAGFSERSAALVIVTLLFTTLLLPYSRLLFSEPLNAFLIVASAASIARCVCGDRRAAFHNAIASGALVLNNAVFGPLGIAQVLAGAFLLRRSSGSRAGAGALAIGAASLSVAAGIWLWWNTARYGHPLSFGYDGEGFHSALGSGLYALLLSVGRGIVVYSAPTCLALSALVFIPDWRSRPVFKVLVFYACCFLSYLAIYAKWDSFEGGWCWGPRFLLPFVPVLHLALAPLFEGWTTTPKIMRIAAVAAFSIGLAVNAVEDLGTWKDWEKETFADGAVEYRRSVFEARYSTLLHGVRGDEIVRRLPLFLLITAAGTVFLIRHASKQAEAA